MKLEEKLATVLLPTWSNNWKWYISYTAYILDHRALRVGQL